jgi:hypothetical protein
VDNKTTIGKVLEEGEKEKTKKEKEKLETKDSEESNAESKDMCLGPNVLFFSYHLRFNSQNF